MTRLIEVLISLAIVLGLFLVIAIVLPSSRHLNQKVETNRKLTIVYDTLDSVRRFKDWNPLLLHDPKMQIKLSGPPSGVGAQLDYTSKEPALGNGRWKIVADEPGKSVTYEITNPQRGSNKRSVFTFRPTGHAGRNIEITQSYDVDYGWDLLGRYAGMYVVSHVGDDMKLGLERLTNMLASVPNVDYRQAGTKLAGLRVVDMPVEDLLVVSAGSIERNPDKIEASIKANLEWIKRSMEASGLIAAGPLRIISTEVGSNTYTFDVVQSVRRGGAAAGATPAATTTPAAAPAAATGPMTGLKLQGPVKYVQTKAHRAVTASYTGYQGELESQRNALRAWALTQGLEITDRPYESYRNGVDQAFTENGQFDVYWDIK
ncbi:MAG: polyketide cyclase [Xanthomonadaceae bacterium]|nr:polyketide cyclase [Xanthomonadaceae bacterium]